jgi:hypothetical protein
MNDTQVIWRHSYAAISSTQLNRTAGIVVGGTFYTSPHVDIFDSNNTIYSCYTTSMVIQKDNFYLGSLINQFVDYYNCTAAAGDQVANGFTFLSNDGTQLIAMNSSSSYGLRTGTLFADETGHVTKVVIAYTDNSDFAPYNAHGTALYFVPVSTPAGQPSFFDQYGTYILYGVIGVVGLVAGIFIGHAMGKNKRK